MPSPSWLAYLAHFLLNEIAHANASSSACWSALLGVAIISYKGLTGDLSLYGVGMGLLSALGWAIGTVFIKRKNPRSIYWFIALPFLAGGLALVSHRLCIRRAPQRDCLEHALHHYPFMGFRHRLGYLVGDLVQSGQKRVTPARSRPIPF
jgi:hypothetical protein